MSVVKKQKIHSALIRLPNEYSSFTNTCTCCVKTSVHLETPSSTIKPQTKQKLLQMIASMQEEYTKQLEQNQLKYSSKIQQLERTNSSLRKECQQWKLRPPEKVIQVDNSRQKQLLIRISELEKQKNNIVSNKVSFIETNLTSKIHHLEHQLQCQKLLASEEISKLKQELDAKQKQHATITAEETSIHLKLQEAYRKLELEVKGAQSDGQTTVKILQNKVQELQKQSLRLKIQLQLKNKELQRVNEDWKERYSDVKNSYTLATTKYQKIFEEKGKLLQTNYSGRMELQKDYLGKESKLKQLLKQQFEGDLNQRIGKINKQWESKLIAAQERAAKKFNEEQEIWLKNQKLLRDQYIKEINILKLELQKMNESCERIQQEFKQKQKQKHQQWNRLYEEYEKEYEKRMKELEASIQNENTISVQQQKEKQYIYIQKLVHSQQGKIATQKYLKLSKQMLQLQTSFKDMQLQQEKLKNTVNFYKSLQSTFDQQRNKWKLERQELIDNSHQKDNSNNLTWVVERIINAQSNNQGLRIDENTKVIPTEHLPCVSYRVVSSEQGLSYLLRKEEEEKISRQERTGL